MPRYELSKDDLDRIDDAFAIYLCELDISSVTVMHIRDLRERFRNADAAYIEEPER